jgi:methyltransferase (TIGR00027 family)
MATGDAPLGEVGETALGAALMRAEESARPERLFEDPYARAFVDAAPPIFPDGPADDPEIEALADAFRNQVAVRTRFYDDAVMSTCHGGCRQVVLLGAGLDVRAYRLRWPTGPTTPAGPSRVRLFELDLPAVLAFKQRVLDASGAAPRCDRTVVPVDLREGWSTALVDAGFSTTEPTVWTAEGLLAYLASVDAARLLTSIAELSAPGSRLVLENANLADDALLGRARDVLAAGGIDGLWSGGLDGDAAGWLRRLGWEVRVEDGVTVAARYGRAGPGASGTYLDAERPAPRHRA